MRSVIIFLISITVCFGQKKVASIETGSTIVYAAIDRPGDLYVIKDDGEALKFDKNGKQIGKIKFKSVPTIFDPRDGTRAFAYYRESQTLESIAPDLSSSDSSPLHPEFAVSAWLVCPSKNEFWIVDSADFTVKKTKDRGVAIAYEKNFTSAHEVTKFTFMREYLNFLFMLDDDGIYVLNNLGKSIMMLDAKGALYFNFLGEELYFPSGDQLLFVDLYNKQMRTMQLPRRAKFTLLTDDRMIQVQDKSVEFFEFVP